MSMAKGPTAESRPSTTALRVKADMGFSFLVQRGRDASSIADRDTPAGMRSKAQPLTTPMI
jgi:hypothetical protein